MLESIHAYLERANIELVSSDDKSIITRHSVDDITYEILGNIGENFPYEMPSFFLKSRSSFGLLAHVGWPRDDRDIGLICSGASDVLSLNYHVPGKLYEEALNKARQTIELVIRDSSLNEQQCLEEFYGHWKWAAGCPCETLLVIPPEKEGIFDLQIKGEVNKNGLLSSKNIAHVSGYSGLSNDYCVVLNASSKKRRIQGKGVVFTAPCTCLPPAPNEDIKEWWKKFLSEQPEDLVASLKEKGRHTNAKDFWIICRVKYEENDIWFGIKGVSSKKSHAPLHEDYLNVWKLCPVEVDIHSKSRLLPRAGASIELQDKKIILVGCGSIGSQIAEQLVSAGVGHLHLVDIDAFQSENLYRHTLNMNFVGANKAFGIAERLKHDYPYTTITCAQGRLFQLSLDELSSVDLLVIATGSPTDERAFNEKMIKENIRVPAVYCWLEGLGVGGHVVYVSADYQSGCLECAYIDPNSDGIQLHSNMNFLKANEPIVEDIGGCGTLFLPYSHLDAIQTATMTSRLALRSLLGKQTDSVKVSWVGDSDDAKHAGIGFAKEYEKTSEGIIQSTLKQRWCPHCYKPEINASYSGYGKIIHILKPVKDTWNRYRQVGANDSEACGILIGSVDEDASRIWVEVATEPMPNDIRKRSRFYMKDKGHQETLNRLHATSGGRLVFLGTWHTHPEANPSFSDPDKTGWKKCINANPPLSHFYFSIIGTESDSVFMPKKSRFEMMRKMSCL